ncbi:MAG: hypothetical protein K9G36_00145 [Crocinitomicaceae bacterium]|nr:hypothetical protein [Crocinitomicaceae bacterium]MCF8444959.1 hypothetical protein [Crocinitomicaceae bacterium]
MSKVFKIIGRTTGIILEWLLIAFFILAFVIRTSTFQTYLASAATTFLSSELNAKINIDKVDILFFDRAALDGVYLEDQQKDTLALINSLVVNIDLLDLSKQIFTLDKVQLKGGTIKINRSKNTGIYNYAFLADYFSSESTSEPKPFNFNINRVELSDIRFNYDDNRKKQYSNGIDWNHLAISSLSLKATDFKVNLTDFKTNVVELKLKEKSGFTINQLAASLVINDKGILLGDLDICTNQSDISASKFNLLYSKQTDFEDFENKVKFDANILQSSIALEEIAFFTSETQGMSDFVRLEGNISNTVNQLTLTDFRLGFGKVSKIEGDFVLPNFSNIDNLEINETIKYAYVSVEDLTAFHLPKSAGIEKINLGKEVERLGFFETKNFNITGKPDDLTILFETTKTKLGEVKLHAPFQISSSKGTIGLKSKTKNGDDIEFIDFKLGELLADKSLNTIDGKVSLHSTYYSNGNFEIEHVSGKVNQIDYQDYSIHNATITNGSLINQVFQSDITLDDDILKLTYTGYVDLKGDKILKFNVNLTEALLNSLNLARSKKASSLKSKIDVDLRGLNPSTMSGSVTFTGFVYREGNDEIDIPKIVLSITRSKLEDKFRIVSDSLIELEVLGKFDLKSIGNEFSNQISNAFPFLAKSFPKKKVSKNNHFTYSLNINNSERFLKRFFPTIKNFYISDNTSIQGAYDAANELFTLNLYSLNGLSFNDISIGQVELNQTISKENLDVKLNILNAKYGKKITFPSISFTTKNEGVRRDLLTSTIDWKTTDNINSKLSWLTTIKDVNNFEINLNESDFSINSQLWHINESAFISYSPELVSIENFILSNNDQRISLDGNLSSLTKDYLDYKLENINLADIDKLFGLRQGLSGMLNGTGRVSDPINNLSLKSTLDIEQLQLKTQAVGDIRVNVDWDPKLDFLDLSGIIKNKGKTNFEYDGKYYFKRAKDNLDFNLKFKEFDISFANAYVDKDVISNIRGDISGLVKITGTPNKPKFQSRELFLKRAKAKVEILGTTMALSGKFNLSDNDVYGDKIEIVDEENNRAFLNFGLNNFLGKWNYDIGIDILERLNPSKRFLVLNTKFKDGDYYYGKVYGTGNCNISGNSNQLDIVVDIKTSKGSKLTLPLYGVSEVEEGDDFITFTKSNTTDDSIKKLDLSGVTLDLNFDVTPETELNVVFNDQTQDKIVCFGNGKIAMKIDDKDNDIKMTGKYNIEKGSTYNFAMGQIKKEFNIDQGSYIEWSDNIYDAIINITTSFKTKSDYGALAPELEETTLANQPVNCELVLNGQLTKPEISFNLKAEQNLPETGKALLNRVLDEQSEINRQFFSLLVFNRFQPLKGNISASGSAALDLAEAQINDLLSKASEEFKMKMNIDSDIELIAEKRFFEDRLIITTSVGVETGSNNSETSSSTASKNTIIGDVRIEYLINEKGTFRVNAFNESNRNTVNQSAGLFSQGAGLNYQEEFNGWNDFQLIQSFLDIFRPKRNKKVKTKRNKRQIKVSDAKENKDTPTEKLPNDKQLKE